MSDPAVSHTAPTIAAPVLVDPTVAARAATPIPANSPGGWAVLGAVLIGALVAVALGAFGALHDPRFFAVGIAGFSSGTAAKAWLSTLVIALALFQLGSAFVMYRLFPIIRTRSWISTAHVWSGRGAVLLSVPVAVHCLYALGFQHSDDRVVFHSLFGCLFYGMFVTKMLLLTRKGLPGWVIPIAGGLLFFGLVYVWLTSALWFFLANGLTF